MVYAQRIGSGPDGLKCIRNELGSIAKSPASNARWCEAQRTRPFLGSSEPRSLFGLKCAASSNCGALMPHRAHRYP